MSAWYLAKSLCDVPADVATTVFLGTVVYWAVRRRGRRRVPLVASPARLLGRASSRGTPASRCFFSRHTAPSRKTRAVSRGDCNNNKHQRALPAAPGRLPRVRRALRDVRFVVGTCSALPALATRDGYGCNG